MTKIRLRLIHTFAFLGLLLLLASTTLVPASAQPATQAVLPAGWSTGAENHVSDAVAITSIDNHLIITWPNPEVAQASAAELLQQLPTIRFQGHLLPMQLLTVEMEPGQALDLQMADLRSQPWQQQVDPAAPLAPTAIDWEAMADPTRPAEAVELPSSPLFVLRQGKLHGKEIAVIALSPLYREAGVTKMATALSARAARTHVANSQSLQATEGPSRFARTATDQSALEPVNADALRNAIKIVVGDVGMQVITGQALAGAGFDLNQVDPTRLQLHHQGEEVALQVDALANGRLTSTSTVRFYTPQIGDRWNLQEFYWLTERDSAGLRMATRSVAPAAAPVRSTAIETGLWEDNQLYDSRYEGNDGDHWFHQNLLSAQASAATVDNPAHHSIDSVAAATTVAANASATLALRLPRVNDTAIYTVSVTTNVRAQHALRVKIGAEQHDITWSTTATNEFVRDWHHVISSTVQSNLLDLLLLNTNPPSTDKDSIILFDELAWQVPVALDFGGNGARFQGVAGEWRYQWANIPSGYTLYDVTADRTPVILTGADATGFQDGPTPHTYLLSGPSVLHTPTVVAHAPSGITTLGRADAIYITPAQFLTDLEPLLQLRRDQGYQATAIDVQTIYDGWSYGKVSAAAIRAFLRYAAATWQPAPQSVVLVGDATVDPHNYEKKDSLNLIPPYLAHVDPWLIEAACEPCYAQLDGDDPLTGDDAEGHFFATDLWLGRLPVKNSGDLASIVNKIIRYERNTSLQGWQNVNVLIADNYIKSIDNTGLPVKDLAGDFAHISDGIVALAPSGVRNAPIYYDPYPQFADPSGVESWRIPNATKAHDALLAQLSAGAGVVTYNGHSHHWQWAITDESPNADPNALLGLYDTDLLTNKDRYFIGLSMTCLTSQFQKPAFSGTVLDERMILNPNGGAISVWGPAGLSVAYGHDLLERGFYEALWAAPPLTAKLGALIEAGNLELLTQGACCQDTLKTFLLLGDPLTTVRAYPNTIPEVYLPIVER